MPHLHHIRLFRLPSCFFRLASSSVDSESESDTFMSTYDTSGHQCRFSLEIKMLEFVLRFVQCVHATPPPSAQCPMASIRLLLCSPRFKVWSRTEVFVHFATYCCARTGDKRSTAWHSITFTLRPQIDLACSVSILTPKVSSNMSSSGMEITCEYPPNAG